MSRPEQIGWATGSAGIAIMLGSLSSYALFFMTTYLGISAVTASLLLALSKGYDMLTDPFMGHISDRTQSKWGRRRPYILGAAIICPLGLVLLFLAPTFDSGSSMIAYLTFALLVLATGYTLFSVPYLAMPAEITTNPRERTVIMSQRIFFSTIGQLAITALAPLLIRNFGGGVQGYTRMSWVMASLVCLTIGITFWSTRHSRFLPPSRRDGFGLRQQIASIWRNRPFRFYMSAKICMFVAQTSVQGTLLFFARFVLGRDEMILAAFGIGYTVGNLISLPAWSYLISRVTGKRVAFQIASFGLGCVLLTWWLAGPQEPIAILYARFLLLGVFSAGTMVSGSAMLPDIMEFDRRQTGFNQEGMYAAAFNLVEKLSNTIGPVIIGTLLGLTGFISGTGGQDVEQPEAAITAIRIGVSIVPFVLALAAVALMRGYDIEDSERAAIEPHSS